MPAWNLLWQSELVDALVEIFYEELRQIRPQGPCLISVSTRAAFRPEKWRVLEPLLLVTAAAEALWRASTRFQPLEVCGKKRYTQLDPKEMVERFLVGTASFIKHLFGRKERELL